MNCCSTRNRRGNPWVPEMGVLTLVLAAVLGTSVPGDAPAEVTMKTGQGETMTLRMQTLPDSRDYRYCELVFIYGEPHGSDIYSTTAHGECSLEWWDNLDLKALAQELGAKQVVKNGPQKWSMDEVGMMMSQTVTIGGTKMNYGATLPPGTMEIPKYKVFKPAKYQNLLYKAGKPVYQLVDPEGHVYVIQGYKVPTAELATLGDKFKLLPEGWEYRVEILEKDLVMNLTPDQTIPSVQDEFDQIYIRIPEPASLKLPSDLKETSVIEVTDARNMRFCEVILMAPVGSEAFNSSGLNECPAGVWDAMDKEALKAEFGAMGVVLNGPKYWMMDYQTLTVGATVSFGGHEQRWVGTLPTAGLQEGGGIPYQIFNPNKEQKMVYEAGKEVFELIDAEGHAYVLQALGPQFSIDNLSEIGERAQNLPEGWSYRTRVLEEDLVLDLGPHMTIYGIGDEFHQYYTRIPDAN